MASEDLESGIRTPERSEIEKQRVFWKCKPLPKERKGISKVVSLLVSFSIGVGIIIYGFLNNTVTEYHEELRENKTTTNTCYRKEEKKTFPVVFNLGLGLLGVILGTFLDRLCLTIEECCHIQSRYNGNICKLLQECFGGISWAAVGVVTVIIIINLAVPIAKNARFEFRNVVYILGGIGVGPLVIQLLELNTQSEVQNSALLEEKGIHVGDLVAWDYYFNNLENALNDFEDRFYDSYGGTPSQEQVAQKKVFLNFKKMILLVSLDCATHDDLSTLDNQNITKVSDPSIPNNFHVYKIKYNEKTYRYLVQYAKEPLKFLKKLTTHIKMKVEDEVKRFYQRLSKILKLHSCNFKETCILVLMDAKHSNVLDNGGLVNCIMQKVIDEVESLGDKPDGIMIPSKKKMEPTRCNKEVIEPGESSAKNSDYNDNQDESEIPSFNNYKIIEPGESSAKKSDHNDNQDESEMPFLNLEDQQANEPARGKDPKKGKPQTKNRRDREKSNASGQKATPQNNDVEHTEVDTGAAMCARQGEHDDGNFAENDDKATV